MFKTISVKELRENFPKVRQAIEEGNEFIVIYRSQPLMHLEPIREKRSWGREAIKELADLKFRGPRDLSLQIDKIVYGK